MGDYFPLGIPGRSSLPKEHAGPSRSHRLAAGASSGSRRTEISLRSSSFPREISEISFGAGVD